MRNPPIEICPMHRLELSRERFSPVAYVYSAPERGSSCRYCLGHSFFYVYPSKGRFQRALVVGLARQTNRRRVGGKSMYFSLMGCLYPSTQHLQGSWGAGRKQIAHPNSSGFDRTTTSCPKFVCGSFCEKGSLSRRCGPDRTGVLPVPPTSCIVSTSAPRWLD